MNTPQTFTTGNGSAGKFYSLPALEAAGIGKVSKLPVSIRIVLESLLRNLDGKKVTEADVKNLANWNAKNPGEYEIPFTVARIVLQDFTGVPLLVDLAAMRSKVKELGKNPKMVEPLVPVDLVVDHSVQVDFAGTQNALNQNLALEFERNKERYQFLKWGEQAFDTFKVVPPGIGIVHQVNLEYLARGVIRQGDLYYPDTLVGTDSHTTMINALGVVGWGVGGIEAEAGMLGQPVYILTPDVVGVHLSGRPQEGVTATDLVLAVTEMLRKAQVVGKFVEFFGDGAASLTLPDRATIANMAPEYGATVGFFPPDDETAAYLGATGRSADEVEAFRNYFVAQDLFGMPRRGEIDYSLELELDLAGVVPSVAGPGRPQDRIALPDLPARFDELLRQAAGEGGYGKAADTLRSRVPVPDGPRLGHGDVLIAAITSCTNTSNPGVMLAAGLLARKAVARGLQVAPHIKTSLAPGSRVVTDYLGRAGLIAPLEALGFRVVAYGCTTCIGNAGPLDPELERVLTGHDLICASVLSGNRNFEARIHPNLKANFLASPPLVVAYAIAGTVLKDLMTEPVGQGKGGRDIYLGDIWPSSDEVHALMKFAMNGKAFRENYAKVASDPGKLWQNIHGVSGSTYTWPASTYIAEPPFFAQFAIEDVAASAYAESAESYSFDSILNTSRAAVTVASMSLAVCAPLTKPASYSAGAMYTPRSSRPWNRVLKRVLSVLRTWA